jgi:hypothetical protein
MTRRSFALATILAICLVFIFSSSPSPVKAQGSPWDTVTISPQSGNWNYPDYFIVTASQDVTLSWEIKCTWGDCFGRQPDVVVDQQLAAGESITVGWGPQCYEWQFDPIDWDHGYRTEPYPEVCALLTVTPTEPVVEVTPTSTTPVETPPVTTPDTPTPTITGTIVSTPIGSPGTGTPTSTETVVTTPPATPGTGTPAPEVTETPSSPGESPAETPRSQLIAVTGADLSTQNSLLPRLLLSAGIVLLGLGMIKLGIKRNTKR